MYPYMTATVRTVQRPIQAGEARVLRLSGLDGGDALVYLDARDNVSRVEVGTAELSHIPWDMQQLINDAVDPHAVCDE